MSTPHTETVSGDPTLHDAPATGELAEAYRRVRGMTEWIREPLSPEDCTPQSMLEASPVKWHLAHTTWFFETFVLEEDGQDTHHPAFRMLFNSYYNTVGEQYPRPRRGLVTRPGLDAVLAYRRDVDERMLERIERGDISPALRYVIEVGLNHEQQHQELILTDLKHLLSHNPLRPVYRDATAGSAADVPAHHWHGVGEGLHEIGHAGDGFTYDNETPRHRVFLEPFEIGSRLVTNAEYLAFIRDGGYSRPELWLSDGWTAAHAHGWTAPLYWEERDGTWFVYTLSGFRMLRGCEPVTHISFYEAEAFARWSGARLPTEVEWEVVAPPEIVDGNFVESGALHPVPLGPTDRDLAQMHGDVWEWTLSPYSPYPGYSPPPGALGEYNGKFMCNQMILRGGSCATSRTHIRSSYRNFFPPESRWQFSGIRLARDVRG